MYVNESAGAFQAAAKVMAASGPRGRRQSIESRWRYQSTIELSDRGALDEQHYRGIVVAFLGRLDLSLLHARAPEELRLTVNAALPATAKDGALPYIPGQ